jgi:hypothetical protein
VERRAVVPPVFPISLNIPIGVFSFDIEAFGRFGLRFDVVIRIIKDYTVVFCTAGRNPWFFFRRQQMMVFQSSRFFRIPVMSKVHVLRWIACGLFLLALGGFAQAETLFVDGSRTSSGMGNPGRRLSKRSEKR